MKRHTTQREIIREVLESAGRPLTPEEILERGRRRLPSLGIATVYRTVKKLHEKQWHSAVELPGQPTRYEIAAKPHHHHFYCRICGRVFDLEGCPERLGALLPQGFLMEEHEITLRGLCPDCQR